MDLAEESITVLNCRNVMFYLNLKSEADKAKFMYLEKRIRRGERLKIQEIFNWCSVQNISFVTKFVFVKEDPIGKNIKNLIAYFAMLCQNRHSRMDVTA